MNPYDQKIALTIGFDEIVSSDRIKMFGIERRKCKFATEIDSNYSFPLGSYTRNFCMMECQSRAALNMCGCQPFFYRIGD